MSRKFDHGKESYKKNHKAHDAQHTKHYLGNKLLELYKVDPTNYKYFSSSNYRMGSITSNGYDSQIDNSFINEHFKRGEYDADTLAAKGISREQQLQAIGKRFDVAKIAFKLTRDNGCRKMMRDIRYTAKKLFDADLRGFRIPK
jgi:hypothetical protein